MGWYDAYDEDGNLIATDVWINEGSDSSYGGFIDFKALGKWVLINGTFIIWCLLFLILPLIFIFLIMPNNTSIGNSFIEGGSIITLWLFSIVNILINIKKIIFIYKLNNSDEGKYKELRESNFNTNAQKDLYSIYNTSNKEVNNNEKSDEKIFIEEIKYPLKRTLRYLRLSLIGILFGVLLLGIILNKYNVTTYGLAFVGPLFAYSYFFDIVASYTTYGKKANWIWLGLLIATFISSMLLEVEVLKKLLEYILLISIVLSNEIIFRIIDMKLKEV